MSPLALVYGRDEFLHFIRMLFECMREEVDVTKDQSNDLGVPI